MAAGARCLRLLTFDVTNTIIRVKGSPGYWYARASHHLGLPADANKLDDAHSTVRKSMKLDLPHYGYAQGMTSKEWWAELVCRVFTAAGYFATPQVYDDISESLYGTFTGGGCYDIVPGSHAMLEQLRESGLRLGVISNFDERLAGVLEGHDLLTYFDFMVTSVMSHCDKPAPKIFHDALEAAQVAPHEVGHVGDDIMNDYWGARKVGLTSFLFDPKRKLNQSDLEGVDLRCIYHDHSELPAKVTKLIQRAHNS